MHRKVIIVAALVILKGALSMSLSAQVEQVIADEIGCDECRLDLRRELVLSEVPSSEVYFSDRGLVRISPDGRVFLVTNIQPFRVHVFSADGRYEDSFGASGEGPAEYTYIQDISFEDDGTIVVYDRHNRRISRVDVSLSWISSTPLSVALRGIHVLSDGTLLGVGPVLSRDAVGFPFHRILRDGSIDRSFGADLAVARHDRLHELVRHWFLDGDELLSVAPHQYVIDIWQAMLGNRVGRVHRVGDLVPGWENPPPHAMFAPPPPTIGGVWRDQDEAVFVIVRVAATDWRGHPEYVGRESEMLPTQGEPLDSYWDTIIEVIDLRQSKVMARTRTTSYLQTTNVPNYVVGVEYAGDGTVAYVLHQLIYDRVSREGVGARH